MAARKRKVGFAEEDDVREYVPEKRAHKLAEEELVPESRNVINHSSKCGSHD